MRALLAVALGLAANAGLAQGALGANAACREGRIAISGVVHNIGTVQEEPGETPQTNFILQKPSCGGKDILVAAGGEPVFCREGERANVSGDYSAPNKIVGIPILAAAKVSCGAGR